MNISFFLRDNKAKSPQRIWSFFRENKESFKIDTGRKIHPSNWSIAKQQSLNTYKYATEYNSHLKDFSEQLEKLILGFKNKKVRLDKYLIQKEIDVIYKVNLIENKEGEIVDFMTFVDEFIKNKKAIGSKRIPAFNQVRKNVILAFKLANKRDVDKYCKLFHRAKSKYPLLPERLLDFDLINIEFLERFREYLYIHQFKRIRNGKEEYINYKKNYIGTQIKILKQFIDSAQEKGFVKMFKFNSVKSESEDVDSVYTDYTDLQKFLDLDLSENKVEEEVRDRYVLNSFLGFRYSDLNRLQPNDFIERKIGDKNIVVYAGRNLKTDKRIEFAVHQTALAILSKYKFALPVLHENTFNDYLKKIGLKAGLTNLIRIRETRGAEKIFSDIPKYKLIGSHTGRRSFCTNFYNNGVSIQAIMSISGHKTEKEFLKYINRDARVNIDIVASQVQKIKPLVLVAGRAA